MVNPRLTMTNDTDPSTIIPMQQPHQRRRRITTTATTTHPKLYSLFLLTTILGTLTNAAIPTTLLKQRAQTLLRPLSTFSRNQLHLPPVPFSVLLALRGGGGDVTRIDTNVEDANVEDESSLSRMTNRPLRLPSIPFSVLLALRGGSDDADVTIYVEEEAHTRSLRLPPIPFSVLLALRGGSDDVILNTEEEEPTTLSHTRTTTKQTLRLPPIPFSVLLALRGGTDAELNSQSTTTTTTDDDEEVEETTGRSVLESYVEEVSALDQQAQADDDDDTATTEDTDAPTEDDMEEDETQEDVKNGDGDEVDVTLVDVTSAEDGTVEVQEPSSTTQPQRRTIRKKKKCNAVGHPNDDDDDDDNTSSSDDETENEDDGRNDDEYEVKMEVYEAPPRGGASTRKHHPTETTTTTTGNPTVVPLSLSDAGDDDDNNDQSTSTTTTTADATTDETSVITLDDALTHAFQSMVYLPPPPQAISAMEDNRAKTDVSSRRRLDRRTLYQGLLLELSAGSTGSSTSTSSKRKAGDGSGGTKGGGRASVGRNRRYLDGELRRSLRSALSLASQPRWRRHVVMGGVGDEEDEEEDIEEEEEEEDGSSVKLEKRRKKKSKESSSSEEEEEGSDEEEEGTEDKIEEEKEEKIHKPTTKKRKAPTPRANGSIPWWWRGGVRLYATDEELEDILSESSSYQSNNQNSPPSNGAMGMWGSQSPTEDEDDSLSSPSTDESTTDHTIPTSTLGMQETVAMALAHSLNCGLALIDDVALDGVRGILVDEYPELGLDMDSTELRTATLMGHLIRLANGGRFTVGGGEGEHTVASEEMSSGGGKKWGGRLSTRMERDLALGLDDPYDELAVESLKLMREEEDMWFEETTPVVQATKEEGDDGETAASFKVDDENDSSSTTEDDEESSSSDENKPPLSLVLFLRTDTCTNLLKSKSAVDRLARECVNDESIHLLMLGKGIDATTVTLPSPSNGSDDSGDNGNSGRMQLQRSRPQHGSMNRNDAPSFPNGLLPPGSQQQFQQGNNPFTGLSHSPPPNQNDHPQMQSQQLTQNNINASGENDPEGSRRFNIFLARTIDKDGTPGIMGAIAPPQAGNLFPQMLQMHAVENYRMSQRDGDSEEEQRKHEANVRRWTEVMEQHNSANNNSDGGGMGSTEPQYFNASIGGMGGNGNGNSMNPMDPPRPEVIQTAIEHAVNDVMQSLAQMGTDATSKSSSTTNNNPNGTLPPHLAQAFSQILSNDNLRRGIAENLARAAPALVDPRCQGVMLSVYVPPGPEHPNRGMMPGQQPRGQQQGGGESRGQRQSSLSSSKRQQQGSSNNGPGAMTRGWLNKILSSSPSSSSNNDDAQFEEGDEDDDDAASDDEEEENVDDDDDEEDSIELSSSSSTNSDEENSANDTVVTSTSTTSTTSTGASKDSSSSTSNKPSKPSKKSRKRSRQTRIAAVAAATAMLNSKNKKSFSDNNNHSNNRSSTSSNLSTEQKVQKHLPRLQALCRSIPLRKPTDPVRLRSWESWAARERGAIVFRANRKILNDELDSRFLRIKRDVNGNGGNGGGGMLGSILRQMLSVKDLSGFMEDVIECAIEIEASRSQMLQESPWDTSITKRKSPLGRVDPSLEQLLLHRYDDIDEITTTEAASSSGKKIKKKTITTTTSSKLQYIHPKSIEKSLTTICRISPSPSGASSSSTSSTSSQTTIHRTRDEISELAKDKHERALVSQVVSPQDIGVSYDMIGGLFEVKELLRQSITYPLKFPHLYSEGIAREAVKGVLLFGPPGTGKTMLAKAVATEGGATFLSVDASCVENKWLGESEKNAKAVFTLARRLAPCVIFIDEVDSILSSREGSSDDSAHGTLTSVKTTMMSEWDGLNSGTNGQGGAGSDRVVVIGSTNRPFDLDEAVLRRFPRRILVDLPDTETRGEILEVTLAENRIDPKVNLTEIAERLEGYTGSDIKEVCREAVVQISHEHAMRLDQGFEMEDGNDDDFSSASSLSAESSGMQRLRPVTMDDFDKAMNKLKRSVSDKGRELMRVWEWNDEYGEIKKNKPDHLPQLMNMFV